MLTSRAKLKTFNGAQLKAAAWPAGIWACCCFCPNNYTCGFWGAPMTE